MGKDSETEKVVTLVTEGRSLVLGTRELDEFKLEQLLVEIRMRFNDVIPKCKYLEITYIHRGALRWVSQDADLLRAMECSNRFLHIFVDALHVEKLPLPYRLDPALVSTLKVDARELTSRNVVVIYY